MSRLFLASDSIRNRFLELLQACGGMAGIIDVEEYRFPLLEDPARSVGPFQSYESNEYDRFAQDVCLALGRPGPLVPIDAAWLAWNDGTVRNLAQAIYDERELPSGHLDAARLAILADALAEAGCTNADILDHCRSPGPHVRGCWVVDLLLGKE